MTFRLPEQTRGGRKNTRTALRECEQDQNREEVGIMGEWSEWKEWRACFFCPTRREEEEFAGGVGAWERTDSPATPTTTQQ